MVNYLDLFKARRQTKGGTPTMTPQTWRANQRKWADAGLCVECGQTAAQEKSLLCQPCEDSQSLDDIQSEIKGLRQQILKHD